MKTLLFRIFIIWGWGVAWRGESTVLEVHSHACMNLVDSVGGMGTGRRKGVVKGIEDFDKIFPS